MYWKINGILIAILMLAFSNGCSDLTSAKPAAERAVTAFHGKYDSNDFESIYNDSHREFKDAVDYENFNEFMQAIYSKLGKVESTESQNWKVGNYNLKTSVTLQQNMFSPYLLKKNWVFYSRGIRSGDSRHPFEN